MTSRIILFAAAAFVALAGCADNGPVAPTNDVPLLKDGARTYIVVFNTAVTQSRVPEVANAMAQLHAAVPDHVYQHAIRGFAARLTPAEADNIAQDPRVAYVEEDQVVSLGKPSTGGKPGRQTTQKVSWGTTDVNGIANYTGENEAWIIDTGIDLDHPDLNVDVAKCATYVGGTPDDGNGHGTHVAGIVAAKNNTIGTRGVAPGASVIAVRVLNSAGSGTWSGVIAGIDYVAANAAPGDVANLSLGGPAIQSVDDAVVALGNAGVYVAIAAGNDGANAANFSPARASGANLYTVSAYGSTLCLASWSNYGNPPVDFAAPGVSILSLYRGGGTATMSGTSMAAPHVAGVLLARGNGTVGINGTINCGDKDSSPDPRANVNDPLP